MYRKKRSKKAPKLFHIPTAEVMRENTEPYALRRCLDEIEESKCNGRLKCYISAGSECVPKNILQKFLDEKYDISYRFFDRDADWFIKISWVDGCNGRIFDEESREYVTIDKMYESGTKRH